MISIVIPTYNRARPLMETITSARESILRHQGSVEVLVIDNNSTDGTSEVVRAFAASHPELDLKLIVEPRQGLSYARNAGLNEARGEIICYLDDDVSVPPIWLSELVAGFALHPDVACIAGRIELAWPGGKPPEWLVERYYPFFSQFNCGDKAVILPVGTGFFGTNVAVLREVALSVGGFNPRLGRRKSNLLGGEDTEFAERVWRSGRTIAYSPGGYVRHIVPASRATFRWVLRRCLWQGVTSYLQHGRQRPLYPLWRLPKLLCNLVVLPLALLSMQRKLIYLVCFHLASAVGPFYGLFLLVTNNRETKILDSD